MKKIKKIVLALITAVSLFGCKNQMDGKSINDLQENVIEKKYYRISDEEIEETLFTFLNAMNSDDARNSKVTDLKINKIAQEKFVVNQKSSRNLLPYTDEVEYSLYETSSNSNNGYAICSNDRRIGPLLAVIDGEFETDISENPFMQIFAERLENYTETVLKEWNENFEESRSANSDYENGMQKMIEYDYSSWTYSSRNISTILPTTWGQGSETGASWYSDAIDAVYGKKYVTGCVATAFAQILAYHRFSLSCPSYLLTRVFSNWDYAKTYASDWDGQYNWSLMTSAKKVKDLSPLGKVMVSTLMYDIAEEINSNYGTVEEGGTGSNHGYVINFMNDHGILYDYEQDYSLSRVQSSINAGNPVMIAGWAKKEDVEHSFLWWNWTTTNYSDGHEWIIDGYANMSCTATHKLTKESKRITEDYVHCNIGWNGRYNGYYINEVFDIRYYPIADDNTQISSSRNLSSFGPEGDEYYYKNNLKILQNIRRY